MSSPLVLVADQAIVMHKVHHKMLKHFHKKCGPQHLHRIIFPKGPFINYLDKQGEGVRQMSNCLWYYIS